MLLGGLTALAVSFLVLPSRAHNLGLDAADALLRRMAQALRQLLAGCAEPLDIARTHEIQAGLGPALSRLEIIADEARRERVPYLAAEPALQPLLIMLLRLRHDLVIIGRAAIAPLPGGLRQRLAAPLARTTESAALFLEDSGAALLSGKTPDLLNFESALEAYDAEIAAYRQEGLTRSLSVEELERLFALGFALEQLHQDLKELNRWTIDFSANRRGR